MATLSLSLAPPALVQLHDVLICLSKFSDTVAIKAEHDLLQLSALNSTKTAFASFACERERFFETYSFSVRPSYQQSGRANAAEERFYCQIYIKALLSIFRGRVDRNKDAAVERCEMELQEDPNQTECRLTVKMICGLGVIKSYKLTYEPASIQHAVFDRSSATNQWTADPRFLRQIIDHFSLSAEQLDMYSDAGKAVFTSFTTKIMEGKEILKYPVHTSVAADKRDFEEFLVEDNMHIAINLKDFKAVVAHAETANATITTRYTRPCKPMQFAYDFDGINAEFTIMTRGDVDGEVPPTSSRVAIPQLSQQVTPAPVPISISRTETPRTGIQSMEMPPPAPRARSIRPLNGMSTEEHLSRSAASERPAASGISMEYDGLFVPADDDRQWDEMNEEEEPQDILGWDASGGQDAFEGTLRDTESEFIKSGKTKAIHPVENEMGIPPTQNMSQVSPS
ncbi:Rad9/DDC1 [Penicillium macrosclerotiorum]|uniref:Rad9/DDC1 n=1 Tax=Penicillium macrosclerotiorum TaxID=303699 RepID=UPI002547C7A7|nr:Rad9/DDC1 [Penicillium macrosclerotiorum]KAJ5666937.1 Rad9/DDC1 [Penicillium macrosclerotiorum]